MGDKNTSNEQNVRSYYMLNHRIRGLLFHYKKNCYFAIGFYFFGKSIQKHPDSVCENDVNNEQNVREYYMSNHWTRGWLFYCKKKMLFWLLFSGKSIQNILQFSHSCSFCICQYSPFCKPVKPLDTTVYYGLVFCAFSWPYMVKLVIVDTTAAPALYIAGQ